MPGFVDRDEVRRLVEEEGAQLVEVLPKEDFDWQHLPGARNIPLKAFDVSTLDPARPVIPYCNDFQ